MAIKEWPRESNNGDNTKPHDAFSDSTLIFDRIICQIGGDEVNEHGGHDGESIGEKVDHDADDEAIWVKMWILLKVILMDYFNG